MLEKKTQQMHFFWLDEIFEKSAKLPSQGDLKIQGLEVCINAYDPEVFTWIKDYLHPLNHGDTSETKQSYSVKVLHCDSIIQSVHRLIGTFMIDTVSVFTGRRYVDRMHLSNDITVDCDPAFGMLWVTDRSSNTLILVLSTKVRWPVLEVSRVVRDLITRYLADLGWVLFHAGAVHTNKKNYIFIGNSGAGKTSLIIALMAAGADFISNERIFVKVKDGEVHILSFPMPIAVGLGTMMQYPELVEFIREPQYLRYPPRRMDSDWILSHPEYKWSELEDKPQFFPKDLAGRFSDRSGVFGGVADGLIVPSFQKNRPIYLEQLNKTEALEIIKNNWFNPDTDDVYPPWMPLDFGQPSDKDVNEAIAGLMEMPSIRFQFSADKNRRNEIGTYPKLLDEYFSHLSVNK